MAIVREYETSSLTGAELAVSCPEKSRHTTKIACQFCQFGQFLFSEPWSIQLLLIVNTLSQMVVNCR